MRQYRVNDHPYHALQFRICLNSVERFNICLPSSIGLQCESGDVSDCNLSLSMEILPSYCKGKLIFSSNTDRDCGSKCDIQTKRSIPLRKGWTKYDRYIINRIFLILCNQYISSVTVMLVTL